MVSLETIKSKCHTRIVQVGEYSCNEETCSRLGYPGQVTHARFPRLRSNIRTAVPIRSAKYVTCLIATRFSTRCRPRHIARTPVSPGATHKRGCRSGERGVPRVEGRRRPYERGGHISPEGRRMAVRSSWFWKPAHGGSSVEGALVRRG